MSKKYIAQIDNNNFVYPNYTLAEYDVEIIHDLKEDSVNGVITGFSPITYSGSPINIGISFTYQWYLNNAEPFIANNGQLNILSVHIQTPSKAYYKPWICIGAVQDANVNLTYKTDIFTLWVTPEMVGQSTFTEGTYYFEVRFLGHRAVFPVEAVSTLFMPTPTPTPVPASFTAAVSFNRTTVCTDPEAPSYTFIKNYHTGGATGTTMCNMNNILGLWIDLFADSCATSPCYFYTYDGTYVKEWRILLSNSGYYYAIGNGSSGCESCSAPTATPTATPIPPTATPTPTPSPTPGGVTATPTPTPTATPTSTPTPTPTATPEPTHYTYSLVYSTLSAYDACSRYPSSAANYYSYNSTLTNGTVIYQPDNVPLTTVAADGYYSNGTNSWYATAGSLYGQSACATPTPTPTPTPIYQGIGIYTGATFGNSSAACFNGSSPTGSVYVSIADLPLSNGDTLYTNTTLTTVFNGNDNYYRLYLNGVWYAATINGSGYVSNLTNCSGVATPTPTPTAAPPTATPTPTPTSTPTFLYELTISRGTTGSSGTACNGTGVLFTVYNSSGALFDGGTVYSDALGDTPFTGGNLYYGDGSNYGRINNSGTYTDAGICL